jgi:predicted SAM-dependent methyltransferase
VIRIIVPDAEKFIRAYTADGWSALEDLAADGESSQHRFITKMEALNHVFVQGAEHYGGYDFETLASVLEAGGFREVRRCAFRVGRFPDGCIDREQHRPYSLYVEAIK